MRLRFERYFRHHLSDDGRSISRNITSLSILVYDLINLLHYEHWIDKQKYFCLYPFLVETCPFWVGPTYTLSQYIIIRLLTDVMHYYMSLPFQLEYGLEFRLLISYELKDHCQLFRAMLPGNTYILRLICIIKLSICN